MVTIRFRDGVQWSAPKWEDLLKDLKMAAYDNPPLITKDDMIEALEHRASVLLGQEVVLPDEPDLVFRVLAFLGIIQIVDQTQTPHRKVKKISHTMSK